MQLCDDIVSIECLSKKRDKKLALKNLDITPWDGDEFDEDIKFEDTMRNISISDDSESHEVATVSYLIREEVVDLEEIEAESNQIIYDSDEQHNKCDFLEKLLQDEFAINFDDQNNDGLNQYEFKTKIKSIQEKYDRYLASKDKEESKLLNEKDVAMVDPIRYSSAQIQTSLPDILNKSVQTSCQENKVKIFFTGPDLKNSKEICDTIQDLLKTCKHELLICNYSIGNGVLTQDFVKKLSRTCKENFKVITDQTQCMLKNMKPFTNIFLHNGVKVKMNTVVKTRMHCKFIVIDRSIVIHGSMNLGDNSLKNYEHFTISDDKSTINQFINRFNQIWTNNEKVIDYFIDEEDNNKGKKQNKPKSMAIENQRKNTILLD